MQIILPQKQKTNPAECIRCQRDSCNNYLNNYTLLELDVNTNTPCVVLALVESAQSLTLYIMVTIESVHVTSVDRNLLIHLVCTT